MSMQICAVVLYGHHGHVRILPFRLGQLNIITGPSLRGKSQLIEIIDYCLGRGKPNLAPGPILDKVSWFGLKLKVSTGEVFVARRVPTGGKRSSEQIYIDTGPQVQVPPFSALKQVTNAENLVHELDAVLGIGLNRTEQRDTSLREPFAATLRHALLFCFQTQNEPTIFMTTGPTHA